MEAAGDPRIGARGIILHRAGRGELGLRAEAVGDGATVAATAGNSACLRFIGRARRARILPGTSCPIVGTGAVDGLCLAGCGLGAVVLEAARCHVVGYRAVAAQAVDRTRTGRGRRAGRRPSAPSLRIPAVGAAREVFDSLACSRPACSVALRIGFHVIVEIAATPYGASLDLGVGAGCARIDKRLVSIPAIRARGIVLAQIDRGGLASGIALSISHFDFVEIPLTVDVTRPFFGRGTTRARVTEGIARIPRVGTGRMVDHGAFGGWLGSAAQ